MSSIQPRGSGPNPCIQPAENLTVAARGICELAKALCLFMAPGEWDPLVSHPRIQFNRAVGTSGVSQALKRMETEHVPKRAGVSPTARCYAERYVLCQQAGRHAD